MSDPLEHVSCGAPSLGVCRECLRRWLNRPPPTGERGKGTPWHSFEVMTCRVVEAGNGFRAAKVDPETTNDSRPTQDKDLRR